jgi:hypothetical protein
MYLLRRRRCRPERPSSSGIRRPSSEELFIVPPHVEMLPLAFNFSPSLMVTHFPREKKKEMENYDELGD